MLSLNDGSERKGGSDVIRCGESGSIAIEADMSPEVVHAFCTARLQLGV